MKTGALTSRFILLCLVFCLVSAADAQLLTQAIGGDPTRNQAYACVRFAEIRLNRVEITDLGNGRVRRVSRQRARRQISRSVTRTCRRQRTVRRRLREIERNIQRLVGRGNPLNPSNTQRLERLNEQRDKLNLKLGTLTVDKSSLRETREGIVACGQEAQLTTSIELVSGVYVSSLGRNMFFVAYYVVLNNWNPNDRSACVNDPRFPFTSEYTVIPAEGRCLVSDPVPGNNTCYISAEETFGRNAFYFAVAGRSGFQEPGTCPDDPARCSLGDATASVAGQIGNGNFPVLGPPVGPNGCRG